MALFRKLFSLALNHAYFNNGIAAGITIRPDRPTASLIRENRLIFRSKNSEIFVAAAVKQAEGSGNDEKKYLMTRELPRSSILRFLIEINDPLVMMISRLPANLVSENILLFSNKNGSASSDSLLLHPESGIEDDMRIPLQKNSVFRFSRPANTEKGTALIQSENGLIHKKLTAQSEDGKLEFIFDLSGWPPGVYRLWSEGESKERFYWPGTERMQGLLGVIEIDVSTSIPDSHRLFYDNQELKDPHFVIRFENRETIWRYHLTSRSEMSLENSTIESGEYPFSLKTGDNGNGKTRIFESDQPIPLLENGIKGIRLKKDENGTERLLMDNMPGASSDFIEPDRINEGKYYSDIYIYI
jgi:hypothetical protein